MSDCPFATGWVKAVADPIGTGGCSLPDGQAFHDTVAATATALTWPASTTIGQVRITKSILRDRDPCVLSDLIAETVRRNPTITTFHLRPTPGEYGSLVESLAICMPSNHAHIHSHYMAAHPVDADPPPPASASPPPSPSPPPSARRRGSCSSSTPGNPGRGPSPSTLSPPVPNGSGTGTGPG